MITPEEYEYTPILGWSATRYDTFSICRRQYFYQYYGKFDREHPRWKIDELKNMTTVPMEVGDVVHEVIKALLKRLQVSTTKSNREKFLSYVHRLAEQRCSQKTYSEVYYGLDVVTPEQMLPKIILCLDNFLQSDRYRWILADAMGSRQHWIIEPPGYGESRLGELKLYCKTDFLFPLNGAIVVIDWKTGKADRHKQDKQLKGYAVWAACHLGYCTDSTTSVIAYLQPQYREVVSNYSPEDITSFRQQIVRETSEMHEYCADIPENIPLEKSAFEQTHHTKLCSYCNYRELCGR